MRPVGAACIGPNAVIQLGAVLQQTDASLAAQVFGAAGHSGWLTVPPRDMLPENSVACLHGAVWALAQDPAPLMRDAGRRTADYIIANRIPAPARRLISGLPPAWGEWLLVRAIARHAWTFAGSGRFILQPDKHADFGIAANPLARVDAGARCCWHEAVFTRLWQRLICPGAAVVEIQCGHRSGICLFDVRRG